MKGIMTRMKDMIMSNVDFEDEAAFDKEMDKEVKSLDEEETGTTADGKEVVDDNKDLENSGLKLEEAIAKIRNSKK